MAPTCTIAPSASGAACARSTGAPAASKATGFASISRAARSARPRPPTSRRTLTPRSGACYKITRKAAVQLDFSEGVPGRRYRHLWLEAADIDGRPIVPTFTYIAEGKPTDGRPSLRYLTLLRDGARAHGLPAHWLAFLESVKPAE